MYDVSCILKKCVDIHVGKLYITLDLLTQTEQKKPPQVDTTRQTHNSNI